MSPMDIIYVDGLNFIKDKEKKMEEKSKILDFLKGKNNRYSYKKIIGFTSFIVATILAFTKADNKLIASFLLINVAGIVEDVSEFLKDRAGYYSYKRILGAVCFVSAVALIFLGKGSDYIISLLLGVSTSAAGISVFEKDEKNEKDK
jgi:hypothetical protein